MSMTQTRKIFIRLEDGKEIVTDDSKVRVETTVVNTCDNPSCPGKKPGKEPGPTKLSWIMEEAAVSHEAVPDDASRMILMQGYAEMGQPPKMYCSMQCVRQATRDYVPPLSPREQARIDSACATVEQHKTIGAIPLPASSTTDEAEAIPASSYVSTGDASAHA